MAIENSSLMREVEAITQNGPLPVHFAWRAEILANEEIIRPLRVLSVETKRQYNVNYTDEVYVEMIMGAGTFLHDVYPFKDDLTITLFREPLGELESKSLYADDIDMQELKATLLNDENYVMEGNVNGLPSKEAMDISDLVTVKFQLLDKAAEQLRMQSTGGIFRDTTTGDILKFLLTKESTELEVDEENKILGVEMVPATNTEPQAHVVIPHGTAFVDMPGFLNETSGIYGTGFGYYLQHRHWYVYPLYDLTRFDTALKTLTLINIPPNKMPGIERTFRKTENQVIALVTGDVKHRDDSEFKQLNEGNGVRFTDARKMIEGFAETKGNKTIAMRAANNNEYLTKERKGGLNNVHLSKQRITSNTFGQLSLLAERAGMRVLCRWEHSDPGSVLPGMPVKFMYMVEKDVVEVTGIVLGAHHYVETNSPGLTGSRHNCHSVLHLFLDRDIIWPGNEGANNAA